ncbi:MAG TPA: hypothetical protein VNH83_15385 [Bryobacteraceae bacterium]|nr:hypothetical protein [Bryobacteraceae bacterium]
MSFSLWIAGDVAWAQGMYESRPMGTAVISVTDLFKRRDFRPLRRAPSMFDASYVGLCASLGDLNATLRKRRLCRAAGPPVASRQLTKNAVSRRIG